MSTLLVSLSVSSSRLAAQDISFAARDRGATHLDFRYQVMEVETGPEMDGDLSDPVWAGAEVIGSFTQQDPAYGRPPTEQTEVRVIRDGESLYIGVYLRDSDPEAITRNILRFRDDSVWQKDDVVRIMLDTFHDHRRGYVFSINPLATKQDSYVDNGVWNPDWDEVWDVRTRLLEDGWSAEVQIPFRILRFPLGGEGTWGFNVIRSLKRRNESSSWAPIPQGFSMTRNEFHGHLDGLGEIVPQRNLQFIPYSALGWTRTTGTDSVTKGDVGGDVKYVVSSAMTLDLTYNTNFAQVEVDEEQVNLTRFSLRFPEKREFFLENAQLFKFGVENDAEMFFSRRIGLENRAPVPILGGGRMTAKFGAFDLGVLSTQTDRVGETPGTNLSASRLRWNFGQRSYVGGILTSVQSSAKRNQVVGPDALIWLGRNLKWEGFLAAEDDRDQAEKHYSYSTGLNYTTDLLGINVRTLSVEEEFEPALGFVPRDDMRRHSAFVRKGFRLNKPWSRRINFFNRFSYFTSQQNILETREWGMGFNNQLESGDHIRFEFERNLESLPEDEPFEINPRKGIVIPPGSYGFKRAEISFWGFDGRAIVPNLEFEKGEFFSGTLQRLELGGVWRASPHFLLEGEYELNDISLKEGDFKTHLWLGRVSVPITARMTVDSFLQWNSLDDTFNTQLRFHLLYGRDSNLFVVFTDAARDLDDGRRGRDQALQAKLTYRFYQ